MTEGFRKESESPIFRGHVITLARALFTAPDGSTFDREIVHHPGAVSVVPLFDDGTVALIRQFRGALDRWILEIPAGKRDVTGEPPEVTAARELEEEVGLRAGHLEKLAEFANSPGFCDEWSHVFLGRDLVEVPSDRQGVEEQHITIERVRLSDVPELIASGELVDAKTIIGLLLTRERLAPNG